MSDERQVFGPPARYRSAATEVGPPGAEEPRRFPYVAFMLQLVGAFGMAACLTIFFLGMRGVMDLGGFVATGGPYAIEHPAPDWVWVIPVCIWVGLMSGALQAGAAAATGGFSLLYLGWSGTFLAGGWNFFEYGFRPPGGGGWAWGWLVCGVTFAAMGLPGLFGLFGEITSDEVKPWSPTAMIAMFSKRPRLKGVAKIIYIVATVDALAAGVFGGWAFFSSVAG